MRIIRSMAGLMGVNEFASQVIVTAVLTTLAWSLKQGTLTVTDVDFDGNFGDDVFMNP